VRWDVHSAESGNFVARVRVRVKNSPGSLAVLASVIGSNGGNIFNLKVASRNPLFFEFLIDIEVRDVAHLQNILGALRVNAAVESVDRVRGAARKRCGMSRLRLGVNIDHVATIRNARGGRHPDPVRAAKAALHAGADGITAHLREDRRHISDQDIERLRREIPLPLNLEMAATPEMEEIALRHRPHAACVVPEKREERTTEGGIDAAGQHDRLKDVVRKLADANIRVSLFIEPELRQIEAASSMGAPVIELHTGAYCESCRQRRCV